MPSTTYEILENGTKVDSKSSKQSATKLADKLADENRGVTYTVQTSAGTEVHSVTRRVGSKHVAPWTRTDSSDKIELTAPKGYETAYVRARIPALVCRALDKSGWLVVTPEGNFEAKDTIEARQLTNELGAKAKAARAKAREDAKAAKAEAKAQAKAAKEAEASTPAA